MGSFPSWESFKMHVDGVSAQVYSRKCQNQDCDKFIPLRSSCLSPGCVLWSQGESRWRVGQGGDLTVATPESKAVPKGVSISLSERFPPIPQTAEVCIPQPHLCDGQGTLCCDTPRSILKIFAFRITIRKGEFKVFKSRFPFYNS